MGCPGAAPRFWPCSRCWGAASVPPRPGAGSECWGVVVLGGHRASRGITGRAQSIPWCCWGGTEHPLVLLGGPWHPRHCWGGAQSIPWHCWGSSWPSGERSGPSWTLVAQAPLAGGGRGMRLGAPRLVGMPRARSPLGPQRCLGLRCGPRGRARVVLGQDNATRPGQPSLGTEAGAALCTTLCSGPRQSLCPLRWMLAMCGAGLAALLHAPGGSSSRAPLGACHPPVPGGDTLGTRALAPACPGHHSSLPRSLKQPQGWCWCVPR